MRAMRHFADVHALAAYAADKMKKNNVFTTDRLFCDVYCFEPGQTQTPHAHAASDKIYYVIDGTAQITVGTSVRDARAGTVALAPAGASHAVHNPGPERLMLLVVMAPKP